MYYFIFGKIYFHKVSWLRGDRARTRFGGYVAPFSFELFHCLYIIYTERWPNKTPRFGCLREQWGGAGDLLGGKLTNLILNLDIQWHMFHRSVKTNTQVWIINVGDLDFELSP